MDRKDNPQDGGVVPISNVPVLELPDDFGIPDQYQFEIFRLRRRVAELEMLVLERNDKVALAMGTLDDEILFWRTGLHCHVWETMGRLQQRVNKLEGVVSSLKSFDQKPVPLEIPERWRKKE